MASMARPQLTHLESILQELSNHEQRTSRESAEQTSIRTQQRLLKEQLLQAQEEIATAHDSKAKLCETIGSLQRAKEERESEIKQLKLELKASRESQSTLMKKMHLLEDETRDMKRGYIKSLACRMKTATQLLSQLQSANVYPRAQEDLEVTAEVADKCEEWIDAEPNKRKRALAQETPDPVEVIDEQANSAAIESEDDISAEDAEANSPEKADLTEQAEASIDPPHHEPKECEGCSTLKSEHEHEKVKMKGEIDEMQKAMEILQVEHEITVGELTAVAAERKSVAMKLQEQDNEISQLQEQLAEAGSKLQELANDLPVEKPRDADHAEFESRIKVLEDNLTQMNAYADHLEIVIGQCPSCSVKVQTESTQDIENKAG